MHFRNRGHGDERRRRVLIEESVSGAALAADDPPVESATQESRQAPAYSPAALDPAAFPLTDLIPTRGWKICLLVLVGLALLGGILSLYVGVLHNPELALPAEALTALDVAARGSLADWYSSFLLALAATASWLVFVVRRHRRDDYRGHYRIWIWASIALWWCCLDAVTRLHDLLPAALFQWTGRNLVGDAALPWLIAYGALLGGLGLRMTLELRRCRFACLTLVLAGLAYAGSAAADLSLLPLDEVLPARTALLTESVRAGLAMLGHGGVLLSVVLYARYVVLEAQGRVTPRVRKPKVKRQRAGQGETSQPDATGDQDVQDATRRSARRRRIDRPAATADDSPADSPSADKSATTRAHGTTASRRRRSDLDAPGSGSEEMEESDAETSAATSTTSRGTLPISSRQAAKAGGAAAATPGRKAQDSARGSNVDEQEDEDQDQQPVGKRSASQAAAAGGKPQHERGTADEELEELQNREGLSKAERRRMRKLQKRQQSAA